MVPAARQCPILNRLWKKKYVKIVKPLASLPDG